ncbi:MAG: 2,4-didehydro-3-deoxy-L-rhamnonate hydrolase, partial [Microbacteriaceae bacterium]|nr:2,4-didehydro-3-deoxy-L-rhamnonate hydrolase [Microbacteriaceae bacterium]
MKLARIGEVGAERPVAVSDGIYYDISGITADIDGPFLESDGASRVAAALAAGTLPALAVDDQIRIGAPITRPSA